MREHDRSGGQSQFRREACQREASGLVAGTKVFPQRVVIPKQNRNRNRNRNRTRNRNRHQLQVAASFLRIRRGIRHGVPALHGLFLKHHISRVFNRQDAKYAKCFSRCLFAGGNIDFVGLGDLGVLAVGQIVTLQEKTMACARAWRVRVRLRLGFRFRLSCHLPHLPLHRIPRGGRRGNARAATGYKFKLPAKQNANSYQHHHTYDPFHAVPAPSAPRRHSHHSALLLRESPARQETLVESLCG